MRIIQPPTVTPGNPSHLHPPGSEEILVFHVPLVTGEGEVNAWFPHLDGAERDRARRFATPELRARFIVAHGATREILAGLLGQSPAALAFSYGPSGKPHLPEFVARDLDFNLSHTSDKALVAVAAGRRVGVDIERRRPLPDALDIAENYFHPLEIQALRRASPAQLDTAFLRAWTRKESYVKAVGGGLSMPLVDFHALAESGEFPRWSTGEADPAGKAWRVGDLDVGGDHLAAVTFSDRY